MNLTRKEEIILPSLPFCFISKNLLSKIASLLCFFWLGYEPKHNTQHGKESLEVKKGNSGYAHTTQGGLKQL
ncbi:hypothetical protein VNO77_12009 [Canavalia gladiata]|uniref:Uncharacterized protein n=1 Tax=Canavalia gladiata TaxID=3824 RepID=A0AAN9LVS9_CANGL